jgi:hypothetical protein
MRLFLFLSKELFYQTKFVKISTLLIRICLFSISDVEVNLIGSIYALNAFTSTSKINY